MMATSLVFFLLVAAYLMVGFAMTLEQLGLLQTKRNLVPVRIRSRQPKK